MAELLNHMKVSKLFVEDPTKEKKMIQVSASVRLGAAKADIDQASKYLESFGVKVGNLEGTGTNLITFELPYKSFDEAVKKLTKKLGKPQDLLPNDRDTHLRWAIKGKGFVVLFKSEDYREADISIRNAPNQA